MTGFGFPLGMRVPYAGDLSIGRALENLEYDVRPLSVDAV